jgi:hypothetical protein
MPREEVKGGRWFWPGRVTPMHFTIHGRRYCLECGWLYCRIVIKF